MDDALLCHCVTTGSNYNNEIKRIQKKQIINTCRQHCLCADKLTNFVKCLRKTSSQSLVHTVLTNRPATTTITSNKKLICHRKMHNTICWLKIFTHTKNHQQLANMVTSSNCWRVHTENNKHLPVTGYFNNTACYFIDNGFKNEIINY